MHRRRNPPADRRAARAGRPRAACACVHKNRSSLLAGGAGSQLRASAHQFAPSRIKMHESTTMWSCRAPSPVGARAADNGCMKTAPSRKIAGEEGDRAKAAAAIAGAWAGRTLKCPRATASRPRGAAHGARRERGHPASAKPL